MGLMLTREIRFALAEHAEVDGVAGGTNGFAGNPALGGVGIFLTLAAALSGEIDPKTGMLVNIKLVDRVLREIAVPWLREAHFRCGISAEQAMGELWSILRG